MTDRFDVTTMSDDELRTLAGESNVAEAPPGKGMEVLNTRNKAVAEIASRQAPPPTTAEQIEPNPWLRGLAAAGGRLQEPIIGMAEKFQLAFPGGGESGDATVRQIGEERTARRAAQRQLEETPAGQFGGFVGQAAPYVLAPAHPLAQAGTAGGIGFLTGGADEPSGFWGEMGASGAQGGIDAAVTGTITKGIQLAGKGIAGARGRYTPEGYKAMELDAAAKRLGLPNTTVGQLDPLAPHILRGDPELAMAQAAALEKRMGATRQVPNPTGGREEQIVPGGLFKAGVEDAIKARKAEARSMYQAVDDYVQANNLPNITPNYTVNTMGAIAKRYVKKPGDPADTNRIFKMLDAEDPQAFAWLKAAGSPKAAKQVGMDFTSYQDARTLVNATLTDLRAIKPANRKSWQNDAIKDLDDLIQAMDNDANRWAKSNSGNQEAVDLFNRAREFYRTVAAPATQNEMARKMAMSQSKGGYESMERMYGDVINPANRSLVDRLMPTASRETQDTLLVMRDLPDVGEVVAKGKIPNSAERSGLGALADAALHRPGLALMRAAPGLRWLSSQSLPKKVYFGAPPTSRALGPAAQYVADPASESIQSRLVPKRPQ